MSRQFTRSLCVAALAGLLGWSGTTSGAVIFSEAFPYADGPLVGASGSPWATHSGTAGQVNVSSNRVEVTQAESEDVSATLGGAPHSTGTLYAALDFNFTALPAGVGNYFFHLMSGSTVFRGKVFASTTGAASGFYRLAITNNANTPTEFIPTDLALGTDHKLVLKYDVAAASATLFLDSPTETGGTAAIDTTTVVNISLVGLRQSTASGNGMGAFSGDNLVVGNSYADVIPEPSAVALAAMGLLALRRRK